MEMTAVHTEGEFQIGGGSGWVASKIADAQLNAAKALKLIRTDWQRPGPGLHPREAALEAAREAVLHLNEALSVEAPQDAIEDTRHALEQLNTAIDVLGKLGNQRPIAPGQLPTSNFEKAIDQLVEAEAKLHPPVGAMAAGGDTNAHGLRLSPQMVGITDPEPGVPHIMVDGNDNPGIVPPWLQ